MALETACINAQGWMSWGRGTSGFRILRRGVSEAGPVPQQFSIMFRPASCPTCPSSLALVGKPVHPLSHEDTLLYWVRFRDTGAWKKPLRVLGALGWCQHLARLEPMRLFEEQLPKCSFTDPVDMAGCSSQPMQTPLGCGQVPARKGQALIAGPPSHFIDVETEGPKTGDG